MARAMFQYTISVLDKVSFDVNLFTKEVKKALECLLPHEIEELKIYIRNMITKKPQLAPCLVLTH